MTPTDLRDSILMHLRADLELLAFPATHRETGTPGIRVETAAGEVLVLVGRPIPREADPLGPPDEGGRPCTAAEEEELDREEAWEQPW